MNQPHLSTPRPTDDRHSFLAQFLAGLALVAVLPAVLWILADPAAALLTLTALGAAGVLVVGTADSVTGGNERND